MRRYLLLAAVLACLFVACTSEAPATVDQPAELIPIKVNFTPFISDAPFFIAQEKGYFTEQGLAVEVVELERSQDSLPPLMQGDLDVIAGSLNASLLNAIAQGANIRIVADKGYLRTDCTYLGLVGNPEIVAAGGLEGNLAAIEGKQFAVSEAAFQQWAVETYLETKGLRLDQFEQVRISPASLGEALASGEVAFGITSEPYVTMMTTSGQAVLVENIGTLFPELNFTYVLFGPNLLEDNPDVGRRFMLAYQQAVQDLTEGKTDENVRIVMEGTGLEESVVREACWAGVHTDMAVDTSDIMAFQEWAIEKGFMDAAVTPDQVYDPSFINYALEQAGS